MSVISKEEEVQRIIALSGTSRSTVFRYLSGASVRASSQKAIEEAMQQMREGGNTEGQGGDDIVISINTSTFDQFQGNSEVLSGIMEESGKHQVHVSLERGSLEHKQMQGAIILGKHDPEEDEEIEMLLARHIPFVVTNRMIAQSDVSYVASDVEGCAYTMCQHLFSQGCSRILFWGELETKVSRGKFNGYKKALEEKGLFDPSLVFPASVSLEEMFSAVDKMEKRPDAFMTMDDETATKAIRIAIEHGYAIPGDLAISGMNDFGSSKSIIPSLTSIKIPFRRIGSQALCTLFDLMDKKDCVSIKSLVRYDLVLRDSTKRIKE